MASDKLQEAVTSMLDRLDRKILRDMQSDSYLCAAKVFENKNWSSEQLDAAVERCQLPTKQVNQFMQQEMQSLQNRVQRCAQDCQDKARDLLPASGGPSDSQIAHIQKDMEKCISRCMDTHVSLLPNISLRIEQAVDQVKKQQQL
ncbi:unnamed protein product [Peronospora belbahrii]|uniref:Protein FAM136A n=1 Tax=Peronospora belbahrii TaxID=622444 RepID=A0ABN8D3R7_9STRA|nr:unnamed protein product [Peronospora belbahrii]